MLPSPPSLFGPINIASVVVRPNQAIIASVAVWPNQAIIALPETEAPHLGVSSGGVEVEGVFAKFARNGSLSSGRQLGRGGSGRYVAAQSAPCPPYDVILGVATISGKKLLVVVL